MKNLFLKKSHLLLYTCVIILLFLNCKNSSSHAVDQKNTSDSTLIKVLRKKSNSRLTINYTTAENTESNNAKFLINAQNVKFDSNGVYINLKNNKELNFNNRINREDETSTEKYNYNGTEQLTGIHWITKNQFEDQKQLLVDNKGTTIEIWNIPIVNKNGTFVFTSQNPCFRIFDDCPAGFQIWEVTNGTIKLFDQVELKDYYVVEGFWKSNNELILKMSSRDLPEENQNIIPISIKL